LGLGLKMTFSSLYSIFLVETVDCDPDTLHLTVEDPSFAVQSNGIIVAVSPVSVATRGRTFSVRAQDKSGTGSEMEVHLVCSAKRQTNDVLKRTKRRWGPPPLNILENGVGPFPKDMERVCVINTFLLYLFMFTQIDILTSLFYFFYIVSNKDFNLFMINALDKKTQEKRDEPLFLEIIVDDVNDNNPEFEGSLNFNVDEQTTNMVVGKVNATDKDDPKTDHVRIKFTLKDGLEHFAINPDTGVITTVSNKLDRETKDKHMVTVEIRDLKGAPNGLSNTATATITLNDINDNPPTFRETSFKATTPENKEGEHLILRIPVDDKDLEGTDNWVSKFVITKGNENGYFRIDTDPKTNEGLLYVTKPLDYEKTKNMELMISAQNKAELKGTTAQWLSVPVNVAVTDIDEGPEFLAPTVTFTVDENLPNGTIIGTYKAIDPETKSSDGITYYKMNDPGSWVRVDRLSGELTVSNTIDRESPLVKDGMYNLTVRAVDASSKTGLGQVILLIKDKNDNTPSFPKKLQMCEGKDDMMTSVVFLVEDRDLIPYSGPFSYEIPAEHSSKWLVRSHNATAGMLLAKEKLPRGLYNVPITVNDQQGHGETQMTEVMICQCVNNKCITKDRSIALGPLGILALLLPLLLLLLLGLLLFFICTTKTEKHRIEDNAYSSGILLPSNTEAPGDEVDSSLILLPNSGIEQAVKGSLKGSLLNVGWVGNRSASTIGGHSLHENGFQKSTGLNTLNMHTISSSQFDQYGQHVGSQVFNSGMDYGLYGMDKSQRQAWQTNSLYLKQKLAYMKGAGDERYADDLIHAYGYEGTGSVAGSIGCCSDFDGRENLEFMNTLGPKFKTLASVCTKR
uniref:Desmocollin 1 n=2 Tax=Cyprinodon variegatus TaxID=28743 RepID=A0A3Q2EI33_CYPVA